MPEDRELDPAMRGKVRGPHPDGAIRRLAEAQHGVMSRRQLLAAGLPSSMIDRRVESGHLIAVHRGVYAPAHRHLRPEGHRLAAVLAVGPGAVASHRTAAALHAIAPSATRIEVSTAMERRAPTGVRVYGRRKLDPADVTTIDGIPATTAARTLVDLAEVLNARRLAKAIEEAERLRIFDLAALEAVLRRTQGRRGTSHAALRHALVHAKPPAHTNSELEDRFLALLDAHRIRRPATNSFIEGMEVDALWPDARLAIELDGFAFHNTKQAFQRDRTRSNDLVEAGYTLLRFTWADVVRDGTATAARVSRALAAARRPRRSAPPAR
jgi:very-short-patch-repair endonuclease